MDALVLRMGELDAMVAGSASLGRSIADIVGSIYDGHQRELFTFALRSCRDQEAAEDVVHEAFVRLIVEIEAGPDANGTCGPGSTVWWPTSWSRERAMRPLSNGAPATGRPSDDAGPESAYIARERQDAIEVALGELEEDARTALLMAARGFNGMEIAEAIGRSGNATRTLMCRTRLQLRDRLVSYEVRA